MINIGINFLVIKLIIPEIIQITHRNSEANNFKEYIFEGNEINKITIGNNNNCNIFFDSSYIDEI